MCRAIKILSDELGRNIENVDLIILNVLVMEIFHGYFL